MKQKSLVSWLGPIKAGSVQSSIYTLCSCVIGSGVMGLPLAVYRCGFLLGTSMLVLGGVTCSIYYKVMVKAADLTKQYNYVGIVDSLYGTAWKQFSQFTLILYSLGMLCSYQAMIAQFLNSVLHSLGVFVTPTGEAYRILIILFMNSCVLFPLSLFRQLSSLRYASVISVVSCLYISLVIFLQTPAYLMEKPEIWAHFRLFKFEISIIDALCITLFAFEATRAIPIVYSELKKRNAARMGKVIDTSNQLVLTLYLFIGIFGYLSHIDNMPSLIVFRPPLVSVSGTDWPMVIARLWIALTLSMGVPINIHVTRVNISHYFPSNYKENLCVHVLVTVLVLVCTMVMAILVPDALIYFKLIGGVFSVIVGKVIPTMVYYKLEKDRTKFAALLLWTLVLTGLGFSSAFLTLINLL